MEAERVELIAVFLTVVAAIQHIFRCIHNIRDIDERLEHVLETNRRNDEEEMRRERLLYRRKRVLLLLNLHRRQRRIWRIERLGGEVFWANVLENFDEVQWVHHFRMSRVVENNEGLKG